MGSLGGKRSPPLANLKSACSDYVYVRMRGAQGPMGPPPSNAVQIMESNEQTCSNFSNLYRQDRKHAAR